MWNRNNSSFLAVLAVMFLFLGACATLPPQTRPADPTPFLGKWSGSWSDYTYGGTGIVSLQILPPVGGDTLFFKATLTGVAVPEFGGTAKFSGGELVLEWPALTMIFRLHGENQMLVEFDSRRYGTKGTWTLSRKN